MKKNLPYAFIACLVMILLMQGQGRQLAQHVKGGIVALEFAWNGARFDSLLAGMGRPATLLNIWLDFLFIGAYTWFLVASCAACASRFRSPGVPRFFIRLALLAGLFDVIENSCMLARIYGMQHPGLPFVASLCAAVKFASVAAVLLFIIWAWLLRRPVEPAVV